MMKTLKTNTMKTTHHLAGLLTAAAFLAITACSKKDVSGPGTTASIDNLVSEKGQNPDEAVFGNSLSKSSSTGYVYTESNDAGQNAILGFRRHADGHLSHESTTPSGGAGTGAGLGSQGAVVLDAKNEWLYAVNAGDNSVSSFRVHGDGSLTLMHTAASGGMKPVSITAYHDFLYVLNAGSDNIHGFVIGTGGLLTPMAGSMQPLSGPGAGGAQVSFAHNGKYLYATEKATDMISVYPVDGMGVAGPGTATASVGQTPFGFAFARNNFMVVSNAVGGAAGAGSATSYAGTTNGSLSAVNGAVANNQAAPCWVAVTRFGRFAFTTNTATDNVSAYYVSPTGSLVLVHPDIPSGDGPIDMIVAGDNYRAYVLCAADHTIRGYSRMPLGGLNMDGSTGNLPAAAAGLAGF